MSYAKVIRLEDRVSLPAALADNAFLDAEIRATDRLAFAQLMVQSLRAIQRAAAGTGPLTGTQLDEWERIALQESARAKVDQAEARRLLRISGASRCDDGAETSELGHGAAA